MIVRRYGNACFTNPLTGQMECSPECFPMKNYPGVYKCSDGNVTNPSGTCLPATRNADSDYQCPDGQMIKRQDIQPNFSMPGLGPCPAGQERTILGCKPPPQLVVTPGTGPGIVPGFTGPKDRTLLYAAIGVGVLGVGYLLFK